MPHFDRHIFICTNRRDENNPKGSCAHKGSEAICDAFKKEMTSDELTKAGKDIMEGKGLCTTCHTFGKSGALRFPDLAGIGARAATRRPGHSDVQYLAESIYEPNTFIVPGFNPGMPVINKPPIGLSDQEILAVIAYLQSQGGKVTVTLQSKVWPLEAAAADAQAKD